MTDFKRIENPVFRQLCERIVKKECIPFLGSGISNDCKYTGDEKNFANRIGHQVHGMKKVLRKKRPKWRNKSLGELCEEYLWNTRRKGNQALTRLVDALQIEEFTHLEPTGAHQYIALLAREGLLPQIITTNYDTALERAFLHAFGEKWEADSDSKKRLSIVHDQDSCVHQHPGRQGSGNVLHLYKINGCAAALSRSKNGNYHSKILLTITQLQSWRDRRWAKDTFRVALRSNTVLFSGFGSDEPQVIHTVHQILDEYSSFSTGESLGTNGRKSALNQLPPNAPVIQSFEPEPSFSQRQIAHNYTQSFGGRFNTDFAEGLILTLSKLTGENEKLDANAFWRWVYQEVQFRLIEKILEEAARGELAVSALANARHLFNDIRNDWKRVSATTTALLAYEPNSNWQTALSNWLSGMLYSGKSYVPLDMNRNVVAELLWLLHFAHLDTDRITITLEKQISWLCVISPDSHTFYVFAEHLKQRSTIADGSVIPVTKTAIGLSRGFSSSLSGPGVIRVRFDDRGKSLPVRIMTFSFRDIGDLANQEYRETGHFDPRGFLADLCRNPSRYWAQLQRGKRARYSRGICDGK